MFGLVQQGGCRGKGERGPGAPNLKPHNFAALQVYGFGPKVYGGLNVTKGNMFFLNLYVNLSI